MSLARRHKDKVFAAQSALAPFEGMVAASTVPPCGSMGADPYSLANPSSGDTASAQIALRLTTDLRDLKNIKSVDHKVAAKRTRIGEYKGWISGLIEADAGIGNGIAAEVMPTMMVWCIDIGEYQDALDLGEFLLRHNATMPTRYQRDVATVLVEEIADAAQKQHAADQIFDPSVLQRVWDMTEHCDMHDQVRAKLLKALGIEHLRDAEDIPAEAAAPHLVRGLAVLQEAQRLNARVGVRDRIKRATKLLAALEAQESAQADTPTDIQGDDPAPPPTA